MQQVAEELLGTSRPMARMQTPTALQQREEIRVAPDAFPYFDLEVATGGYAWWYLDALSDDQRFGLTLIAFIGSVFSPYYAASRRRRDGDPLDHCAVNVALYGSRGKRWSMTERGRAALQRDRTTLAVGPSAVRWEGQELIVDIDETAAPLPSPIRGQVRVIPQNLCTKRFELDAKQRHVWWPIAPLARIEVSLERPRLRWRGSGYLDHNTGSEPLEDAFVEWDWSRAVDPDGTTVAYDLRRRDGSDLCLALRYDRLRGLQTLRPPPSTQLRKTCWRIERRARLDSETPARLVKTLEDTPFYARSLIATKGTGSEGLALHETLRLDRFRNRGIQFLLPFRMPRRSAWPRNGD